MEETIQSENSLGTEKVGKLLRRFAIPSIISLVVNALYNMVDQIFIGQGVGYLGNASTNIILPLMTVQIALGVMLSDGTAAFLSLMLGNGEKEKASKGVANCLTLTIALGVILCVLFEIFLEPLCHLFGCTEEILPYAMTYGRIIILGFPWAMITYSFAGVIRADGRPKESMIGMLVGCVTNVALDALFVLVFDWGMAGAAWATIIGQALNAAYFVYLMFHFKSVELKNDYFKPVRKIWAKTVSLGMPSFVTQMATVFVILTMNNVLTETGAASKYGSEIPLAVMGITQKLCLVVAQIALGIAVGAQPIVGYNYGNKRYDRVKETFRLAITSATLVLAVSWVIFELFPEPIIRLFGDENELYMEFAIGCVRVFLSACFMIGSNLVIVIFNQAIGKAVPSTILSFVRQIVLLVPAILILGELTDVNGVIWAGPISDALAGIISIIYMACTWKSCFKAKEEK